MNEFSYRRDFAPRPFTDVARPVSIACHGDGTRRCDFWNLEQTVCNRAIHREIDGQDGIGGNMQKAGSSDPAFCA